MNRERERERPSLASAWTPHGKFAKFGSSVSQTVSVQAAQQTLLRAATDWALEMVAGGDWGGRTFVCFLYSYYNSSSFALFVSKECEEEKTTFTRNHRVFSRGRKEKKVNWIVYASLSNITIKSMEWRLAEVSSWYWQGIVLIMLIITIYLCIMRENRGFKLSRHKYRTCDKSVRVSCEPFFFLLRSLKKSFRDFLYRVRRIHF